MNSQVRNDLSAVIAEFQLCVDRLSAKATLSEFEASNLEQAKLYLIYLKQLYKGRISQIPADLEFSMAESFGDPGPAMRTKYTFETKYSNLNLFGKRSKSNSWVKRSEYETEFREELLGVLRSFAQLSKKIQSLEVKTKDQQMDLSLINRLERYLNWMYQGAVEWPPKEILCPIFESTARDSQEQRALSAFIEKYKGKENPLFEQPNPYHSIDNEDPSDEESRFQSLIRIEGLLKEVINRMAKEDSSNRMCSRKLVAAELYLEELRKIISKKVFRVSTKFYHSIVIGEQLCAEESFYQPIEEFHLKQSESFDPLLPELEKKDSIWIKFLNGLSRLRN